MPLQRGSRGRWETCEIASVPAIITSACFPRLRIVVEKWSFERATFTFFFFFIIPGNILVSGFAF